MRGWSEGATWWFCVFSRLRLLIMAQGFQRGSCILNPRSQAAAGYRYNNMSLGVTRAFQDSWLIRMKILDCLLGYARGIRNNVSQRGLKRILTLFTHQTVLDKIQPR
jgi:hypothetical protein